MMTAFMIASSTMDLCLSTVVTMCRAFASTSTGVTNWSVTSSRSRTASRTRSIVICLMLLLTMEARSVEGANMTNTSSLSSSSSSSSSSFSSLSSSLSSSSSSSSSSSLSSSSSSSSSSGVSTLKPITTTEVVYQRFAIEPMDQTAVVGSRVTLPCRVLDQKGPIQWTKDDFGLGAVRNLTGYERYAMIGSDEEGDFSLHIYPVELEDDGVYQCQASPTNDGQPALRSRFARLSVLVPPEPPKILQGDFLVTTEDRELVIECVSVAGKPPAEITWIDGRGNVQHRGIETTKELFDGGPLYTVKSILKVMPRKEHDNTTFTCQSQNAADRTPQSAKLRVEVRYAPKVSLKIRGSGVSDKKRIVEGTELRFKCRAEGNPPDMEYRWFINEKKVIGDYTTEMIIHNATRDLHDAIVKCEVHNDVGKSEETETLDITYGPQFRHPPVSVETHYSATEILQCDVDGNPTPEILWYHEDSEHVVARSPNISVFVSPETSGRYFCKALVPGFPLLTGSANIFIRGPPSIVSQRIQYVPDEGVVKVKCTAISVPKAESVVWSFAGRELNFSLNNTPFYVQEEYTPERVVSTVTLDDPVSAYFGDYNCTVTNSYGTDSVIIKLTAHIDWQMILIIVGLVVCLILVGIIVLLILQCRDRIKQPRPRTAQTQETDMQETDSNADRYRESDRSSNLSDVKADIRAGSSVSNAESVTALDSEGEGSTRGVNALALAGPVPNPLGFRYSADYTEPSFPPKNNDGSNNNGYVPYVDYTRDYMPPTTQGMGASRESLSRIPSGGILASKKIGLSSANLGTSTPQTTPVIDPRFSATYGNPYLRMSAAEQLRHAPHTAVPGVTPAPPPYTQAMRMNSLNTLNGAGPQAPLSAHYITGGPNGGVATVKRTSAVGTLATHV
ncbi:PREDICTED: irregular chiasm C-roughest protein-like isoform X2 [Polistes dominula]|uniref:Irregular chiasm C-roughest protein-like isoform X2 n=1 Tax=Polistes dominula TaxID=743375 RepID=A0ABM1J3B8_POLDO|nr:PREDICTED: irregular chiasm C-roughest protein-like isoform X2 [Polistes dominula]